MLLIRHDPPAEVTRSSALFYSSCTWSLAGFRVNCRFFSPFPLFPMEILSSEASLSGTQLRSGFGVWMNMLVLFPFFYSQQWSLTNGTMGVLIFFIFSSFLLFPNFIKWRPVWEAGWEAQDDVFVRRVPKVKTFRVSGASLRGGNQRRCYQGMGVTASQIFLLIVRLEWEP